MKTLGLALLGFAMLSVQGCASKKPPGVEPVQGFALPRYLGTWYEVARLDHRFERGLEQVSATYSLNDDSTVRVLNKGYATDKAKWKSAEGKARFVGSSDQAFLKVSFFGPFYGSYVVFDLDTARYQHAFVAGPSTKYLWLLSRTPTISDSLRQHFVTQAAKRGFDTTQLIWVKQGD